MGLRRNTSERLLGGVCSGLGEYFFIGKTAFRLIFVFATFIPPFFIPTVAYLVMWVSMED